MRKRILIVDDEKGFTEMVKLNLEATGYYEVVIENKSAKAVHTIRQWVPDLVLLDVIMPEFEGPDVLNEIRSHADIRNIPVIFLTATVTPDEVREQSGKIGGHVFLAKPTNLVDLIKCIEREIAKSAASFPPNPNSP